MGKLDLNADRPKSAISRRPITRLQTQSTSTRPATANIKVVVRVRPHNNREQGDNTRTIVRFGSEQVLVFDPQVCSQGFFYHGVEQKGRDMLKKAHKNIQFMFDRIFGYESTNQEIFENTTKDLIKNLMNGFNCSVFAYGATGAGKTFTMLGNNNNPGITYLTMAALFQAKEELSNERDFQLGITYLEVYNEQVQDLLNPGGPLQLRDDGNYGVMVAGIKVHKIASPDELFTLLAQGNANRTQHPTDANAESSRSHAVFQVYIQMQNKVSREMRTAKLSMIDLAGSERGSVTGFGGARFTEGANINKSLLALGNCINSLADGQKYVPYRDSKLTRLLKDSLGGNCQTVMIANVSPSSFCYEDTYNTLKYATRAKKIKSDIKRNVVNSNLHVGEYVKIVADLKNEVEMYKAQLKEMQGTGLVQKVNADGLQQLNTLTEERVKLLERLYNVESSESMAMLRRKFKEDADARLSGLIGDSPLKREAHGRLGRQVDRFQRQEDTLKKEIDEMKGTKADLENKVTELVEKYPEMEAKIREENEKLLRLEIQHLVKLMQKKDTVYLDDHKSLANLVDKSCKMLKSCYFQLRGHGFISESQSREYDELVNYLQGRKNITWTDGDEGSTMRCQSPLANDIALRRPLKRRLSIDENCGAVLDATYVFEPPMAKMKACEDIVIKVTKSPNVARKRLDSTKTLKDNKRIPNSIRAVSPGTTILKRGILKKPEVGVSKKPPFRT